MGLGLRTKTNALIKEANFWLHNRWLKPNLYQLSSPERLGVVYHKPSDMCSTDCIMLYALVRGLRPARALEIGARWGGSARIITNAMEENGVGKLVGIDPAPEQFRASPRDLHGRYELVKGYSPDDLPLAIARLDGAIDFVFIDALHTHDAVLSDFQGVLPYLTKGAHVLLHDTYHQGIYEAVNQVLAANPELVDCGFLTRNPSVGEPVSYQGLRLVRQGSVDGRHLISEAYCRAGKGAPEFSEQLWNYDKYANRIGKGVSSAPAVPETVSADQR